MNPLGLIAGEGIFPILVARGAKAAGRKVVCVGLSGNAWPQLKDECDEFHWAGISRLGRWIYRLKHAGCNEAIMVGRVQKTNMYAPFIMLRYIPDLANRPGVAVSPPQRQAPQRCSACDHRRTRYIRHHLDRLHPLLHRPAGQRRRDDPPPAHRRPMERHPLRLGNLPADQPDGHRPVDRGARSRCDRRRSTGRHQRDDRARRPPL